MKEGVGVFATGQGDENAVVMLDHVESAKGLRDIASEFSLNGQARHDALLGWCSAGVDRAIGVAGVIDGWTGGQSEPWALLAHCIRKGKAMGGREKRRGGSAVSAAIIYS